MILVASDDDLMGDIFEINNDWKLIMHDVWRFDDGWFIVMDCLKKNTVRMISSLFLFTDNTWTIDN
jgi:hypothetical protein